MGSLGAVLGDLGWSWGGLWGVLGRLGASLGRSGAVLENQRVAIEKRFEIASDHQKKETLWSYACRSFSKIRPKIDPKSTEIEKIENRSGATPVMVSAVWCWKSSRIATEKKRSGATPVVVSAIDRAHRK